MMNESEVRGDRDTRFRLYYKKYYWRVVRYFVSAFRVSQEDAEDLTQEAFFRFYEAIDDYRGDAAWAYLEKIALRTGLNNVRFGKRHKRHGISVAIDDPAVAAQPAAPAPDYVEQQHAALRRTQLYEAIETLAPSQRECVHLYLKDFSLKEIADTLHTTEDAVKSRLRDARKALRARLGSDDIFPEKK